MSRRLIVILVLGMLVLTSVQMVSATDEVTWWRKREGYMYQTSPTETSSYKSDLGVGEEASWDAENAAQVDLTFPAGTWTVVLYAYTWGNTVSTTVTVWNEGTGETICEDTINMNSGGAKKFTVSMTADPASFSIGDRIATSVKVNSGGKIRLYYDAIRKPARLESPSNSPAYPGVPVPDIEIKKTASPTEGAPCTDVTFAITVTNTGDCTLDPVKVVDTLPAGMSYVSSDPAGSAVGNTITWTTSLGMGASQIIHLVAHIDAGATGTLTDSVTATGTPPAGDDATDTDTADVEVLALGISVEKVANPTSGAPFTDVTFAITVTNTGDCTLDPVEVVDTLPAGMSYVSDDSGGSAVGNTITWTTSLGMGASQIIHLVAHIDAGASGTLTDSVTATGTPPAGDDVTDTDTADVTVLALGISVEKVANPTSGAPFTDVTFAITVTNTGDCTLNPVTVVDTLPAGMSYVSDDFGGSVVGNTITWTTSLGMGASQIIHLVAHIDAGATGTLTDSVTATGTPPAGDDVTDIDTADVEVLAPGISVEKVANPTSGAPFTDVTFAITVTNTGDCTLDPVTVVDTLPAGMSYVSSDPAGSVVGNTITWNVGPLASEASKTITLKAHIDAGAAGMLENVVTATGTPPEGEDVHDCDTADIDIEVLARTIEPPQQTLIEITTDIKSDGTVIEGEQFGWETGNGNLLNNPPLSPGEAVGGIKYDEKMLGLNGTTEFTKCFNVNTNVTPNLYVTKTIGYKSGDLGSLSHAEQVGMHYFGASPPLSSNTTCEQVNAYSEMAVTNVQAATETEVGITETHERSLLYEIYVEGNGTVSAGVDAFVDAGRSADAPASRMMYKEKSIGYGNFTFRKEVGYTSKQP